MCVAIYIGFGIQVDCFMIPVIFLFFLQLVHLVQQEKSTSVTNQPTVINKKSMGAHVPYRSILQPTAVVEGTVGQNDIFWVRNKEGSVS